MDLPHVPLELHDPMELLAALHALEGLILLMFDLGVFFHAYTCFEVLSTDEAGVRFHPGVSPDVVQHLTLRAVAFPAYLAGEGSLAGVRS